MYVPIVLAAILFNVKGGILAGIVGGLILGPFMPIDTTTGEMQLPLNWLFRMATFIFIGTLVGSAVRNLHQNGTFIKTILNNLPIGVAVNSVEPAVNFVFINENFARLYGTTKEAINANFWEAAYEDSTYRERIKQRVLDDIASGDPARMHWKDISINRERKEATYITAQGIPLPGGKLIMSTVWDTTERKNAEDELRTSEQLLSHTLDASPVIIYRLETDQLSITWVSENISRILGYTAEEALKPGWWEARLHPEDRDEAVRNLAQLHGEDKLEQSYRFLKENGETVWLFDKLALVSEPESKDKELIGAWTDITEQKKAEEERISRQAAEVANRAKSDFLANMSHELRTPLNSVLGFSEILQDEIPGQLNEKQAKYVDHIYTSGKHLLSLINDILDLAKVEAGKLELELSEVELSGITNTALIMLKEKALKKNLTLTEEFAPNLPPIIYADERRLKQILFNLLSNAVKFTPAGGQVILKVVRRQDSGDPERKHNHGDYLHFAVEDTGIGLSKKDQKQIFSMFFQAEEPLSKEHEGTGLGLALCKQLVELHGGHIWFSSNKGKGSIFNFTIPLRNIL
jgi:PAS domain S-box-containing protein